MDEAFKSDLEKIAKKMVVSSQEGEKRKRFNYDKHHLLGNQAMYVMSMRKHELIYQKNIHKLLGWSENEFSFDSVFSLVHPEDYPIVKNIVKSTMRYSLKYGITDDSVLYISYRLRKKSGDYIRILRTSGVCSLNPRKTLNGHYSIIQDIEYLNLPNIIKWHWESPLSDRDTYRKYIDISPKVFFTERQIKIYQFIKKGLSSREIAAHLGISINTVYSHRKLMLSKTSTKTTSQMIEYFENQSGDRHF